VIERRIENLQALDYPADKLEIVVTSDASTDGTDQLAAAAGARVIRNERGGKVAAQNRAVRDTDAEVLAFSMRTPRGSRMLCAVSFATSPTRMSHTSVGG
jgi:cellulose synthase/poly-beta-1,6-N-acetylglucosamine synthase-like glycosyltransferase